MTIGQPLPRPDGKVKVTGRARYAADNTAPNLLHAVVVTATVPAGRVTAIETAAALDEAGVILVLTHADMPRLAPMDSPPIAQSFIPMQSDEIRHEGQPIAIVLGNKLEAAEAGAQRIEARYERAEARVPAAAEWPALDRVAVKPKETGFLFLEADFAKGSVEEGFAAALRRFDAVYVQPSRHHNAMEPSATLAAWEDGNLTVYDSTQHVYGVQAVLAKLFGVPAERVRVICPHTGGGFGVKGCAAAGEARTHARQPVFLPRLSAANGAEAGARRRRRRPADRVDP
jgi:xanthine dehydrogenase YagR molybdenum-binding subunit